MSSNRWLRVRRGAMSWSATSLATELSVPAQGARMILGTHSEVTLRRGELTLPRLGGALLMVGEQRD